MFKMNNSSNQTYPPAPNIAQYAPLDPKKTPITDDYEISNNVLGLGINGKVVECVNKKSLVKFALKVS